MTDTDSVIAWLAILVVIWGFFLAFLRARDWWYDFTPVEWWY